MSEVAASALELRPRGAVELVDAAVRLGGRSSGTWLLCLPGALALCGALIHLQERVARGGPLGTAMVLLGLAWCLRALCQGAATHHLRLTLLAPEPPTLWASVRAALRRSPSLLFTATALVPLQGIFGLFTLGLSFLISPTGPVAYAAAMERRGSLFGLWREASRALGPTRATAIQVRWASAVQLLLLVNLQLVVSAGLILARSLLGLDVAQLLQVASPANPGWWVLLVVITFALFEPVRAATGTLLLLDARVRREGMDLHARLEQLTVHAATSSPGLRTSDSARRAALGLLLGLALSPLGVRAEVPEAASSHPGGARIAALVQRCTGQAPNVETQEALARWEAAEASTFGRWSRRIARQVEVEGCQGPLDAIARDLAAMRGAGAEEVDASAHPRTTLDAILSRPEFAPSVQPERVEAQDEARDEGGLLAKLWAKLREWLAREDEKERPAPKAPPPRPELDFGFELSWFLLIALPILALLIALPALRRAKRVERKTPGSPASSDPAELEVGADTSALSRAPDAWLHLADALAAEGRHREAIRSAYLATLAGLHHGGAIHYDAHRSNWDYLQGFRGPPPQRSAFRELTLGFDFAWYGERPVGAEAWSRFREVALPLVLELAPEAVDRA